MSTPSASPHAMRSPFSFAPPIILKGPFPRPAGTASRGDLHFHGLGIISGAQSGVDRAALDVAKRLGLPRGGYCPKGRRSKDGRIPESYPLCELPDFNYLVRTRRNIEAASASLILNLGPLSSGTLATVRLSRQARTPHGLPMPFHLAQLDSLAPLELALLWLNRLPKSGLILNVAGPSEEKCPGIAERARLFLHALLTSYATPKG